MGGSWKLVGDIKGEGYYWERRSGDVTARVGLAVVNGSSVWFYQVSCAGHTTMGYKENERLAKVEGTRLLKWYKIREYDFKRTRAGLRDLWKREGIENVEPDRGNFWEESSHCTVVYGVKWGYDFEKRVWRSGAWRLWCEPVERWMLQHPDGYVQELHVSGRNNAMYDAAFWMSRCLA